MRPELRSPQPSLVQQEKFSFPAEAKVGHSAINSDSAQEHTSGRPNIDPIPTATVDVSLHVTLDAVGDP